MHSRIFQMAKKEIGKEDYVDLDRYYDTWFTSSIADYVDESDRNDDINWFKGSLRHIHPDLYEFNDEDSSVIFKDGFQVAFFASRYEDLKELVDKMDVVAFSTNPYIKYQIHSLLDNKYGFYVDFYEDEYDSLGDLATFDSFIRNIECNVKYYIGGTVDYHA